MAEHSNSLLGRNASIILGMVVLGGFALAADFVCCMFTGKSWLGSGSSGTKNGW